LTAQPEARFVREGDWLVVRVSGPFIIDWFVGLIAQIAINMRAAPATALLVDTLEVYGALNDLDRYRFGMAAVNEGLAGPIAFVGKEPGVIDPRRFGEVVARNRGVNVRVFTDETAARAWLREQTGVSPAN
jgi:hypothetical protein